MPHFYVAKLGYAGGGGIPIYIFLVQNIDCGYSLEQIKVSRLKPCSCATFAPGCIFCTPGANLHPGCILCHVNGVLRKYTGCKNTPGCKFAPTFEVEQTEIAPGCILCT